MQLAQGAVGTFLENVPGRGFEVDGPWQKPGIDVTEFKLAFGKVCLAPMYDFGGKEIAVRSIS